MSELRPLFGEDFFNAYGFNEETVQLAKGSIQISIPRQVEKRLTSTSAILEDSGDIKGLCKALHITEMELQTLQQYGLKNFNTLVKFITDNVKSKTLVCSIYIITHELEIKKESKPAEKNIKQIGKIILGHHVLMCIPLEKTVHPDVIESINGAQITSEVLESFKQEAIAIFDYDEIHRKPGAEIFRDSRKHEFGEAKALFAQLAAENCEEAVRLGLFYIILIAGAIVISSMVLGSAKK